MLNKAIEKIKVEMEQNKSNPYIQVVGCFLLQHLNTNPEAAEKIMATDNTISKSLDAMRNEASKKKVGNCAVLTDSQGFEIVLKYFGITGSVVAPAKVEAAAEKPTTQTPAPAPSVDFDINLEDLLL